MRNIAISRLSLTLPACLKDGRLERENIFKVENVVCKAIYVSNII
jgi:hypothetical protein